MTAIKQLTFRMSFVSNGDEVMIRKDEETGELVLSQRVSDWDDFFRLRDELGGAEPEFMEDVHDPVPETGEVVKA